MLKEVFFLLTLPLTFFFTGYVFVSLFKSFKTLEFLEKWVISLTVGLVVLTTTLVLVGISPLSFRLASKLFYWGNIFGLVFGIVVYRKNVRAILLEALAMIGKLLKGDIFDRFFISLLIIFVLKIILFLLLKPIVDADVINYYLPFARTFYLEDKIPLYNFYDHTPIFTPPPGMSVLYAFAYSVSQSLFSESFRFLPLPFILGTVGVLYLMAQDIFGRKGAQLTTLIFIFLPLWDALGMAGIFYPDIIFLFLVSVVFYLFLKNFEGSEGNLFLGLITGLALGSTLLFKFQGIFLYYFLFLLALKSLPIFNKWINIALAILALSPFLIDKSKIGIGYFRQPSFLVAFVLLLVLFLVLFIFFRQKKKVKNWHYLKLTVLIFLVSLPLALVWFLRNYFVFGHPFSLITTGRLLVWKTLNQILPPTYSQPPLTEWTIFLLPSLASFWLLPKLFFIVGSFWQKKWIPLLTLLISWYVIWFFYLDAANDRHLLPIFPLISLMVFGGIYLIGAKLFKGIKVYYFSLLAVILGAFFSFSQSLFIWWNWGIITYGNEILHQIVKETSSFSLQQFLIIFNSQGELFLEQIPILGLLSLMISFFILVLAITGLKFSNFLLKFNQRMVFSIGFLIFLPYILTFYLISDGNLAQFAEKEQTKVYNYWGLTEAVVPYLMKNTSPNDIIVYFGIPQVGLAYFSNLRVYNLLGEDLGVVFKPIFYEPDSQVIYSFLKAKNINYFVINQNTASQEAMRKFKELTKIPQTLEDTKYFEPLVFPDKNIQWVFYKIKREEQ